MCLDCEATKMKLVHGGDWAGYRAEFGRDALDFSANVSPLGLPAGVAAAITAALPMAARYPIRCAVTCGRRWQRLRAYPPNKFCAATGQRI